MSKSPIPHWHEAVDKMDRNILEKVLHKDCVFHSPILFKPQEGKRLTKMYLEAAFEMFQSASYFKYVKEVEQGNCAVLEFNSEIDGIHIDGIDMITWNEEGLITEFKVMIRPLKAIDTVKNAMFERLQKMTAGDKMKMKAGMFWDRMKG